MICASLTFHAKERLRERTSLTPDAFLRLLDQNRTVSVGVEPFTRRRHRLLYSEANQTHFVAIQDFETGEVVTLLPIDYHENLAWKISEKALRKAVWAQNPKLHQELYTSVPPPGPGSKVDVTGVFFYDGMRSANHNLGSHRFERMPQTPEDALLEEAFVDKLIAKVKQKNLELRKLEEIVLFNKRSGEICKIPWSAIDDFALDGDIAEPGAAPNGDPATPIGDLGVAEGPPSAS